MKKPILLITILVLIIISLFGVRAFVSNRLSTSGVELGKIQEETNSYKTKNFILSEEIYTLSSLNRIASLSAKLGFSENTANYSLTKDRPIAFRQ